jgi:hypothetical protein
MQPSITRDLSLRLVGATLGSNNAPARSGSSGQLDSSPPADAAAYGYDNANLEASDPNAGRLYTWNSQSAPATEANEDAPERRVSTTQTNRERVEENRRHIAGESLANTTLLMGCLLLVLFVVVIAGIVIYIRGWMVWSKSREKPCDQPLQWWLFIMLLIPIIQCQLSNHVDDRPKRLQALIMPTLLCSGVYLLSKCKTCSQTNPNLYQFVKLYLIFQSVIWLVTMFMFFCFVTLIYWARMNGLLEQGPGPAMAAKPGTIDEIETVPYSPSLFEEWTSDEPPECTICQEEFNSEKPIKKTPCGHYFHAECLGSWLEKFAKSCPLCRLNLEEAVEQRAQP